MSKEKRTFAPTEKQKQQIDNWINSPEFITSKITLEKITKDVVMNKTDLSAYIKQEYGDNLSDIITSRRLNRVEKVLSDEEKNNLTMVEVLEEGGFQAPSTFFQAFYERHKMSPLAWKKRINANHKLKDNS
ncbi:MAG: helix-turn-helix domain-containing protein [Bacteroides sp.]|nr:helix-turn-helix domain-containing protein [Bacteroides sp.]